MKVAKYALGITVIISLSGCQNLGKNYLPDKITTYGSAPQSQTGYIVNDVIDLSKVNFVEMEGTSTEQVNARTAFAANMLALSDEKCEMHKATIYSNAANWNMGTGVVAILLSGYASVASSAVDASRAAALSAATIGVQGQVNQEVYQAQLSTAIIRAIDKSRQTQYEDIVSKVGTMSTKELIMRVNKYHSSCSLLNGLSILTAAVENQRPSKIQRQLEADAMGKEIDNLEKKLRASGEPKDSTDMANLASLKVRRQELLFPDR